MTVTNDSNFHIAYKVNECYADLLQLNAGNNHYANIQIVLNTLIISIIVFFEKQ